MVYELTYPPGWLVTGHPGGATYPGPGSGVVGTRQSFVRRTSVPGAPVAPATATSARPSIAANATRCILSPPLVESAGRLLVPARRSLHTLEPDVVLRQ